MDLRIGRRWPSLEGVGGAEDNDGVPESYERYRGSIYPALIAYFNGLSLERILAWVELLIRRYPR